MWNLNEGQPWPEEHIVDLTVATLLGKDAKEIAEILCRSELEVLIKAAQLKLPLEWVHVEEA